ncbi:hypothetical protein KR222_004185 [Zaprionus bogoriensis]|nr:hypothetical protein KR222_004185 [Zaprionus bogoriensis]
MHCNCAWLLLLLVALLGGSGVWGSASCPSGFTAEKSLCVHLRPIHGTCPPGSTYQMSINKCVHA